MKANMFKTVGAALIGLLSAGAGAQLPPSCLGSVPCKLDVNLPEGDVLGVWPAPNSTRVVFVHRGTNLVNTLYSVPVGGGSPTRLTVAGANFRAISPDGTRMLYTAVPGPGQPPALFSVPIAGPASASVRLASNVTTSFARVQVSPDSRKVVYTPAEGDRLRAVPIDGPAGAGVRLTDPFVAGGFVTEFEISANSRSVVYRAYQDTDGVTELYRVPLTLSPQPDPPTVKLNAPLVEGGQVLDFRLAANNGPVVYRADQDANDVFELYSVQLGGSGRVKINRPLPAGWDVAGLATNSGQQQGYTVVPNGTRAVYEIQNFFANDRELYTVPVAGPGSASVRLDATSDTSEEVSYQVSSDSIRVVYSVQGDNGYWWSYSVPTVGPASASLLVTWPSLTSHLFTLSPDGNHVVWVLDPGPAGNDPTLHSTPIAEGLGDSVRLNGTEIPTLPLLVNATSTRVVYETDDGPNLFSAPINGSGTRYNLTEPLDAKDITRQTLTTNGQHVVYTVRRGDLDAFELFSSRLVPSILPPT